MRAFLHQHEHPLVSPILNLTYITTTNPGQKNKIGNGEKGDGSIFPSYSTSEKILFFVRLLSEEQGEL
jgi:hypothetical protein